MYLEKDARDASDARPGSRSQAGSSVPSDPSDFFGASGVDDVDGVDGNSRSQQSDLEKLVNDFLRGNPSASGNEVFKALGGNRGAVMRYVKAFRDRMSPPIFDAEKDSGDACRRVPIAGDPDFPGYLIRVRDREASSPSASSRSASGSTNLIVETA